VRHDQLTLVKVFRKVFKYILALAIAALLLWLVYRQIDLQELFMRLGEVKYGYIIISIILMLVAHWVRAFRWSLILKPAGFKVSTFRTFNAVILGYFANLFLPRMGEITRCGVLKRTDNVSMTVAIGTVIAERIVDLLTLFTLVLLNLILEYELLGGFFKDLFSSKISMISQNIMVLYIIFGALFLLAVVGFLLLRSYKSRLVRWTLFLKIRRLLKEVGQGLISINKLERKMAFWVSTVAMWILYYLLTYVVIFSIEETSGLSLIQSLTILVTGSIGMATPVQGGIGAFHALVSSVLVLYGIAFEDGILFATVLHSSQVFSIIAFGSLSVLVTLFLQRKRNSSNETNRG